MDMCKEMMRWYSYLQSIEERFSMQNKDDYDFYKLKDELYHVTTICMSIEQILKINGDI